MLEREYNDIFDSLERWRTIRTREPFRYDNAYTTVSFGCIPDVGINDLGVELREAKYFMISVLVDDCPCEALKRTRKEPLLTRTEF